MATSILGSLLGFIHQVVPSSASGQVWSYHMGWKICIFRIEEKGLWVERLWINSLPNKLQSVADEEIAALLSDSCLIRIRNHVLRDPLHSVKWRCRLHVMVVLHLAGRGQFWGLSEHSNEPLQNLLSLQEKQFCQEETFLKDRNIIWEDLD